MAGMSSLGKSWSQLLRAYTAVGGGENENAGFAAWMLASVLLGEPHPFRLAVERLR